MTALTSSSLIVGHVATNAPFLREIVGAYELVFRFSFAGIAPTQTPGRHILVQGAHVKIRHTDGQNDLGFARPEQPALLRQEPTMRGDFTLTLVLQPHQLMKLEELRNGGDLAFSISLIYSDGLTNQQLLTGRNETPIDQVVPRSTWVEQLRIAGALHILLLEIPMPMQDALGTRRSVVDHLECAQRHLAEGNFRECVAETRLVLDELGVEGSSLAPFKGNKEAMTKIERQAAVMAALRHYMHQAHHSASDGGETQYSRREATLALQLTAAYATFVCR